MLYSIIQTLGYVVDMVADMVKTWVGVIFAEGNELILVAVLLPLVFIGIRALKNLISVNA